MSIDYRLTLAGSTPVEQIAARAFPDAAERPTGTAPRLSAALFEKYGFSVSVYAGQNGYLDAESDHGHWEWEPDPYVSVSFTLDKFADLPWSVANTAVAVHRLLNTGPEDAALDLNGNLLLLTRVAEAVAKHNRDSWWSHYPAADQLIPG
jgi:hypothetical protein